MDDYREQIDSLKKLVDTARQEIELAVMFHETWRPTAYDTELHSRIGISYAAHAFQIVRLSLRRELLLALTRVWDKNRKSVRMSLIADRLRDANFFEALVQYRAKRIGLSSEHVPDRIREALTPKRNEIIKLIGKYSKGGEASDVLTRLITLRNEHLAHRQILNIPTTPNEPDTPQQQGEAETQAIAASDDEIEEFYQDNLEIMQLLLSVVMAVAYDLSEATSVYRHHAKYFWAAARGERTIGHPNYFPQPPSI